MDQERVIERARVLYRAWEAQQASRPWYVKAWDRARSECGYWLHLLGGK